MADASDLTEFGEIFSDYDPETEQLNTLDDANDAMYDLLGMSPEDKEKAHKELAEEDKALGGSESGADSTASDSAPSDAPEEKELTMKEKAEAEALEFMRQANAAASEEASREDTSNEEDRLNNMLDDIFSEEEASATEAPSATEDNSSIAIEVEEQVEEPAVEETALEPSEAPVDSPEPEVAPKVTEEAPSEETAVPEATMQPEVSAPEEGAISSTPDVEAAAITTDEPQIAEGGSESIDAIEHMNSIIDSAASAAEVSDMPGLDGLEISSIPDAPEPKAEFKVDISNVDMGELKDVDISDDLLSEIDLTEDLTNGLNAETDLMNDDSTLSKRQLKKKQKAEQKAAKKAAKEAKKLEKAAKKLKPEEKDPNDIIADIEEAFANDDVVGTMEKVAQSGVEGAAEESLQDVDLNQFIGDDGGGAEPEEKKSFKEKMVLLLFGPPEEGDIPTEEELAAKKAAKEAKIAAKEQAKEEKEQKKKEAQEAKAIKKSQAKEVAVVKKAAAKDKKAKIAAEEEAEDAKEKKINPKQVVTTFVILAVLAATVVLGTNEFNYHMVIARATNYFEMQKYRKAYDQIVGVDIKDRDQEIKDKILCVMYVQQQIDSYNNFTKLEMYENALDSLIKGVRKYNEHYEEAKAMGISSDLDGLHATIEKELKDNYGLSMEVVNAWTKLDQKDYTTTVLDYVAHMNLKENNSMSMINDDFLFTFD